jgi:hypothetical protein
MLHRLSNSPFFPISGRPVSWERHPARCIAPRRHFATLVAVQKKNSLCEPNLETMQYIELKGARHENAGNSGQQVAQADGMTNLAFRGRKITDEPNFPPPSSAAFPATLLPESYSVARPSPQPNTKNEQTNPIRYNIDKKGECFEKGASY